jgi:2-keto-4-pentenoate hydratase/2-oxohepta-3-ene-1,7-dioic acid hydratase in catechol pathway
VVIGSKARNLGPAEAVRAIGGYTCVNDVTCRDLQKADGQWGRAKGFDTFCPVGPRVAQGLDWRNLEIICRVNGVQRQRARATDMHFPIPDLVSFLSGIMTLEPGDLIATGTPAGTAPLNVGDTVEVEIPGVGVLSNPVKGDGP